ncbi:protein unc-50 homolog [Condylostylus longicornis]|uniref:protein unc-50 homolog n=1 Tax=Condylostylus longicornis TaxID=2530218 RepID=UPI00244E54AF|nr:protein unc-50 homolog [Condylostylus longicornis]XP_055387590.1 protein unc-50 homolog [Condylostylus longicornis]
MRYTTSTLSHGSRSASPLPAPANYQSNNCLSATSKSLKFLRRLFKFDQMDFEFALWQMIYLFISPQKVYRNFNYRKQTKAQFARDDPAFLVLLVVCLFVTSLGFGWVLDLTFWQSVSFIFYVIFVDCIFAGIIVATFFWIVTNRYLRASQIEADIEWGYAFDVHLNAFFPPLMLLHFVQLLFYNWAISLDFFISRLFGNTFWLLALGYYIYITFLGYNCIPHLKNTRLILIPLPILFLFYLISIIIGWNVTVSFIMFYKYRVY